MTGSAQSNAALGGLVRGALLAALALGMVGCKGFSAVFGNDKSPPDEFAVLTKAPLVIPPEFSLRPPEPGAPGPQDVTPETRARQTVFAIAEPDAEADASQSSGELALLTLAGADQANPAIRDIVTAENTGLANKERTFADRVLFWRKDGPPEEPVVDASGEFQRVRTNEAAGKPVTEGQTPTASVERRGGLFNRIFGF